MPIEEAQTTLRDDIENAVEQVEAKETPTETVEAGETESQREERLRDEKGRFVKEEEAKAVKEGKEGKDGKAQQEAKAPEAKEESKAQPPEAVPQAPQIPRPPRPSSWKKEYWDHWEKIDPQLATYLNQRESDFAKGVSTYKQEWDQVKPIADVVNSFRPILEQQGIDPAKQIGKYFEIHRTMAQGSPEQKLSMFLQMAKDYQVPVQQLFVRGQDGQIYFNQQLMHAQQQQPQPQVDVEKIVESKLAEKYASQETQSFMNQRDSSGNPVHPHFETVRDTMAQLLEAGLADDLESAYEKSIRLHPELFEAVQKEQHAKEEAERQRQAREDAERAKRNAVSVKGQTPQTRPASADKGLRSVIEEAYEAHVGGRV